MRGLSQSAPDFYTNEQAVAKWTLQTYWDTLGRDMSPTEWIGVTTPQVVNAFNLLSKNSVNSTPFSLLAITNNIKLITIFIFRLSSVWLLHKNQIMIKIIQTILIMAVLDKLSLMNIR
jgi:hypothetical protein